MKAKFNFISFPICFVNAICIFAGTMFFAVDSGSAQTTKFFFTGSETNITLNPGNYEIITYGAPGGANNNYGASGGLGAEMAAGFRFTNVTTLTLIVGGAGVSGPGPYGGAGAGGGGGGSFVVNSNKPLVIAGGGGGAGSGSNAINGGNGQTNSTGGNASGYIGPIGAGGVNGNGGGGGANTGPGGGGGGYYSNGGGYGSGGGSFLSGGVGGSIFAGVSGGFGGGGAAQFSSGGGGGGYSGGGGGTGSNDQSSGGAGGGGGSIIDSSAIAVLSEVPGIASPDDSLNGEIIIIAVSGPLVTNIVVSPSDRIVSIGTNQAFAAIGYFSDGSVSSLSVTDGLGWSSSNLGVATIDTNGVATALSGGTTAITATVGGASGNALLGVLFPISGQNNTYLFTGSKTNINLNPGTYNITAYGAQGGWNYYGYSGGLGAQMEGQFYFSTPTTITLLVGEVGGGIGGGGGGGSFVAHGNTPLLVAGGGGGAGYYVTGGPGSIGTSGGYGDGNGGAGGSSTNSYNAGGGGGFFGDGGHGPSGGNNASGGFAYLNGGGGGAGGLVKSFGGFGGGGGGWPDTGGGGGGYTGGSAGGGGGVSYIDSSAIRILNQISGIASPDDSQGNGEIIIRSVPVTIDSPTASGGQFDFNITGPVNATIVIEASTNLTDSVWIPMATNTLSNGTNHFHDAHATNYPYRFYRVNMP